MKEMSLLSRRLVVAKVFWDGDGDGAVGEMQ